MTGDEGKLDEAVRLMHDVRVQVEGIRTRLDEHVKHQDERTRQRDIAQAAIVGRLGDVESRPAPDPALTADHEQRLRALERARWIAVGAATATGGLAGAVAGLL